MVPQEGLPEVAANGVSQTQQAQQQQEPAKADSDTASGGPEKAGQAGADAAVEGKKLRNVSNKALAAALSDGGKQRGDVSAFAYRLVSLEVVRYFDERGEYGKLEQLGFSIGYKFAERFARNNSKYANALEVIKFMCKDLWAAMFGKFVDKLQTNHKGIYILHDNTFSWMASIDIDYEDAAAVDQAKKFLIVPCGLVRGALSNLGVKCVVRAEFSTLPACLFNVQIVQELLG